MADPVESLIGKRARANIAPYGEEPIIREGIIIEHYEVSPHGYFNAPNSLVDPDVYERLEIEIPEVPPRRHIFNAAITYFTIIDE